LSTEILSIFASIFHQPVTILSFFLSSPVNLQST